MNSVEHIFALLKADLPMEMNNLTLDEIEVYRMDQLEALISKVMDKISPEVVRRVFDSNLKVLDSEI